MSIRTLYAPFGAPAAVPCRRNRSELDTSGNLYSARKLPGGPLAEERAEQLIAPKRQRLIGGVIRHVEHIDGGFESMAASFEAVADPQVQQLQSGQPELAFPSGLVGEAKRGRQGM